MHWDHPPLPELPRATEQQAAALLTASPVNPGGVSFCSRVLCLLEGSSVSFRSFPCTLSSGPCPGAVNCPLQRVPAAETAAFILGALPESLLDGDRTHLVVLHGSGGSQKERGQGHNWGTGSSEGHLRAEGTSHSSQWQPRSEKAPVQGMGSSSLG